MKKANVLTADVWSKITDHGELHHRSNGNKAKIDKSFDRWPTVPAALVHIPGLSGTEIEARVLAALELARIKAMDDGAPCSLCGYNGPGWYQPKTHQCAGGLNG